ncbi:MAG: DUF2075 domain-containing protein [Saprospiraceae bacterium]|nr:DUF2075 domain-containing protein [Saprospiraceae bacterium]
MIVYHKSKGAFWEDILTNDIGNIVSESIKKYAGKRVAPNELRSFNNSLMAMGIVVNDPQIPDDCSVCIEYHIPQTSKRIDFIIGGKKGSQDSIVIVELKQWQEAQITSKDGLVKTILGGSLVETSHPSYQAWSYAALLLSFNATVEEEKIQLFPCAYLHNYIPDETIGHTFYQYYLDKAPVFLKPDARRLQSYIKEHIHSGDSSNVISRIDHGKIRPTKSLADSLRNMIKGNQEFVMIDDQKVVYENALFLAHRSTPTSKNVLIVEGGPGTGKSVVAINLLVELNRKGIISQYVTKTSAPRDVYFEKLAGDKRKVELKSLFVGSGSFIKAEPSSMSTLIIDEAHRLTERTGFLRRGDNQIKEILDASCFSIFFIDEKQRIHLDDYGEPALIEQFANEKGIKIHKLNLESQFRCNGSDGYLAWLDNTLQLRDTANKTLGNLDFEYDFRIFDNPTDLQEVIYHKNEVNNKARLVAGYCWPWKSKKDKNAFDIEFPDNNFKMQWNLGDYGGLWIIDPNSVTEIGCIHTAQGLEVDYVGVIIGDDLIVRDGVVITDASKRAPDDRTVFGWKKGMKEDPGTTKKLLDDIIKNTYRTLMTRGMKGCYIYCTDEETREYFKQMI